MTFANAAIQVGPTTLAAAGLMLGKPMSGSGFPRQLRFTPYGYLRNTTQHLLETSLTASVAMGGMGIGANASRPEPSATQTVPLVLLPGELRQVPLDALARLLEHRMGQDPDSLEGAMLNWSARFDGRSGDLLMTTGSTDASSNYVFEVMPQRLGRSVGQQLPYWNTAGGNDTMYSLWNPGAVPQNVVLTLYSADGMHDYATPLRLAPGASAMVDVNRLRMEGLPNPAGQLLPPDADQGSAMLEPAGKPAPGPGGKLLMPKTGPIEMQVVITSGIFNAAAATVILP